MTTIIIKEGKIPDKYIKYSCKECCCEFAKDPLDYERINLHPYPGCKIIEVVVCPCCNKRIRRKIVKVENNRHWVF